MGKPRFNRDRDQPRSLVREITEAIDRVAPGRWEASSSARPHDGRDQM
jgi:hypothetical protein